MMVVLENIHIAGSFFFFVPPFLQDLVALIRSLGKAASLSSEWRVSLESVLLSIRKESQTPSFILQSTPPKRSISPCPSESVML